MDSNFELADTSLNASFPCLDTSVTPQQVATNQDVLITMNGLLGGHISGNATWSEVQVNGVQIVNAYVAANYNVPYAVPVAIGDVVKIVSSVPDSGYVFPWKRG